MSKKPIAYQRTLNRVGSVVESVIGYHPPLNQLTYMLAYWRAEDLRESVNDMTPEEANEAIADFLLETANQPNEEHFILPIAREFLEKHEEIPDEVDEWVRDYFKPAAITAIPRPPTPIE